MKSRTLTGEEGVSDHPLVSKWIGHRTGPARNGGRGDNEAGSVEEFGIPDLCETRKEKPNF